MRANIMLLAAVLAIGATTPARTSAQDYLGIHLDTQNEANLRRHQQGRAAKPEHAEQKYVAPIAGSRIRSPPAADFR